MLELSIVIVNWNMRDFLEQCLCSILDTAGTLRYEIVVVDNASEDGSTDMVREKFCSSERVRLVANFKNEGFARGNNQGYARSYGEFILLLNPDTVVKPGALCRMVEYAREHVEVGIVGCRFLNPDGTLQRHYRRFPSVTDIFFTFTILGYQLDRFLFHMSHNAHYHVLDLDFTTVTRGIQPGATCVLIPRRVVERIGGLFDEAMPIFFNDVDLCRRVLDGGLEIHILPDAEVVHYLSRGVKQLDQYRIYDLHYRDAFRYFRKHASWWEAAGVYAIGWIGRLTNRWLLETGRALRAASRV